MFLLHILLAKQMQEKILIRLKAFSLHSHCFHLICATLRLYSSFGIIILSSNYFGFLKKIKSSTYFGLCK